MRNFLILILYFCLANVCVQAQLTICTGQGSEILYYNDTPGNTYTTIYNFDPSLPLSATNPSVNSISLPPNAIGLAVSDNLNASSPSPTFYTVLQGGNYAYYNGTTWVNTNHYSGLNVGAIAGGGGYIYNYGSGYVARYDGTSNATQILSGLGNYVVGDVAADCAGNVYVLDAYMGQWLKKYNSNGTLLTTWSITGETTAMTGGGLTIIDNHVYYNSTTGFWDGVIGSSTVTFTQVSSYNTPGPGSANDFAACAFGAAVATTNFDTIWHCAGGVPDTLIGYGTDTLSWAVLSGPATLGGSGDTVTVNTTGNARLVLSSTATAICGSNKDTVQILYVPTYTVGINGNSPLCLGDSLHLSGSSTQSGVSYQWNGPNGFADSVQNTYRANTVFADSGYYVLSADYHGCDAIDSILIHIKPIPAIPIAASNSPLCAGDSLKLTVSNSQVGISYQWSGPNVFSSSIQNPVRTNVVLADAGKYRVRATLNGCSSGYDSTDVVINAVVVLSVSISSLPTVITAGHVDTFTATTNCSGATYQWYKNGTAIPGATTNPYLTLLAAGDIITVEVHCSGCADPDSAVSNSLTTVNVENVRNVKNVSVWPNPFVDELTIGNISSVTTISIYNVLGQSVYKTSLYKNNTTISTKRFAKGVYVVDLVYSDGMREVRRVLKE